MTPSQAHPTDQSVEGEPPAAASLRVTTLCNRADFLRASRAPRVVTPGFILQMRKRRPGEAEGARVGFTCSKKVGNAVARNRAKRRLREIARQVLSHSALEGMDYVLIGRAGETANRHFATLLEDLRAAVAKLHEHKS